MTREEAISVLERVAHTESKWPGTEDTLEALHMAISALRQQETVTERHELTNAQRIRAMSDEELAQWLASKIANLKFIDIEMSGKQLTSTEKAALTHDLYVVFGRYLKQPAEEDDHE